MSAPRPSPPDGAERPRTAVLVLGCLLPVYDRCIRMIRSTWGATPSDDIDVFYVYGRAVEADLESVDLAAVLGQEAPLLDDDEVVRVGDVILCGTGDVYADQVDGILRKRLLAMGHLAEHERYDFVYHVCASSYLDLDELRRYLTGLPRQGVYHGPAGLCGYSGHPYVSGASMLLSADVAARLADAAADIIAENDGVLADDVAIGRWIAEHWCEESTEELCERIAAGRPATDSQLFVLPHGRGMTSWIDTVSYDQRPRPDVFHYHFDARHIEELGSFHRRFFAPATAPRLRAGTKVLEGLRYGLPADPGGGAMPYQPAQRELQDLFDTRRLADRLEPGTTDTITPGQRAFIEARELFFLASADADGWPQCSYKGGDPGFVRVVDEHTVVFPLYDGNGMFLSAGNILANPKVGLLFVDLEGGSRLRLNGEATVADDDPLLASYPGALLVVRVRARAVFANCRRYVHHYELVERSPFVPTPEGEAPVPDWKRHPYFDGSLPAADPAHDPDHPDAPSIPDF